MIRLTHRLQQHMARHLLVLLAGVWSLAFIAPCVMATPGCLEMESPCATTALQQNEAPCETLQAVDCRLQASDTTVDQGVTPNFAAIPVRLSLLPAAPNTPDPLSLKRADKAPAPPAATPLYLRNTTLLL
jgi:hypothetical protein